MSTRSKRLCTVRNLLALNVIVFVVLGGTALGQEWTPDKDQVVEQPKPYSPYVDQHFPSGCSSAIPTFTPRCLWTAAWLETRSA